MINERSGKSQKAIVAPLGRYVSGYQVYECGAIASDGRSIHRNLIVRGDGACLCAGPAETILYQPLSVSLSKAEAAQVARAMQRRADTIVITNRSDSMKIRLNS